MDPATLTYYALVCGCLALVSPRVPRHGPRFVAGLVVGLVAAGALPPLRLALGL
jgi:hypothetical protein